MPEVIMDMKSIWYEGVSLRKGRRRLPEKIEIAVVGGGMAGILCGWLLQEAGFSVLVLEAKETGSGQTGKTTAKITSQHGLIYDKLSLGIGEEAAGKYARASQAAIDEYERIIKKTGIDCGFERLPSYLYTNTEDGSMKLERERTAAVKAGLPASIVYDTCLPFPVKKALKFENQAQFYPLEFLYGLAKELDICENTKVLKVKDHRIYTNHGILKAEKIIFAFHFPFPNWPGFYFARMHQERSYVLALKLEKGGDEGSKETPKDSAGCKETVVGNERGTEREAQRILDGMYYGIDSDGLSFREAKGLVLLGGMGHRTGDCPKEDPYEELRKRADTMWKGYTEEAAWSAQDCMTLDSVPYIGKFSRLRPDWYVATGFGKWGMTNSMVSAMLIRDSLTGRHNPDWEVFSPQRITLKASYQNFFANMGYTIKNFFVLSGPRCSHLGCRLKWNRAEKTWDCPCHGSRFEKDGNLIDNPAVKGIGKPGPRSRL